MKIAVDFDGTIVENEYPEIGKPMLFAFETLKELQKRGHQLILWTYREGEKLEEAVEFCRENGIEFFSVNHSYPEEAQEYMYVYNKISRKIDADLFIDDRNIGGFLGWSKIFQLIHPESGELKYTVIDEDAHHNFQKKKGFLSKLLGKG